MHTEYVFGAVFPSEILLRDSIKLVEVKQPVDASGGVCGEVGRGGVRYPRNLAVARRKKTRKLGGLRRRYSRAGLEEVLSSEQDEESWNRGLAP